ncbi:hypothetical protein FOL47_008811 [Perkinsus chesapeaki]|uniref:Uncharacterized protein n=1 Tax=Perkinsus chesapeaki TaxID=330153 RepID=A0A7J6LBP8_PERCH|nr:hypothetical protein FOL47_008811 [Perkinsus chesapeaki]
MAGGWLDYSIYFRTRDGVDYMDISLVAYVPELGPERGNFFLVMNGLRYTEHSFGRYHGISPDWDSASAENQAIRRRMALELQFVFYFVGVRSDDHRFPNPDTFLDTIVYDTQDSSLIISQTEPPPGPPFVTFGDAIRLPLLTAGAAVAPIVCSLSH